METLATVLVATAPRSRSASSSGSCRPAATGSATVLRPDPRLRPDDARVRLPDPGHRPVRSEPVHGDRGGGHLRRRRRSSGSSMPGSGPCPATSWRRQRRPDRPIASCSGRSSCRCPAGRSRSPRTRASSWSWRWSSSVASSAPARSATTSSPGSSQSEDFGKGLAAGTSLVLLGIMLDRITQGAGGRRKTNVVEAG